MDEKTKSKVILILQTLLYYGPEGVERDEFHEKIIPLDDIRRILNILESMNCVEGSNVKRTHFVTTKYFITKTGLALYLAINNGKIPRKEVTLFSQIYRKAWKQWQNNKSFISTISQLNDQKKILELIHESNGISINTISKKTGIQMSEVINICDHLLKRDTVKIKKLIGGRGEMYFITDKAIDYSKNIVKLTRYIGKRIMTENLSNLKKFTFNKKNYLRWKVHRGDRTFEVDEEY